jgi:hypothetical protein
MRFISSCPRLGDSKEQVKADEMSIAEMGKICYLSACVLKKVRERMKKRLY